MQPKRILQAGTRRGMAATIRLTLRRLGRLLANCENDGDGRDVVTADRWALLTERYRTRQGTLAGN